MTPRRQVVAAHIAATCRASVPQQPPIERQVRQERPQRIVCPGQLDRVALVELGGRVELGVTAGRGVGAQPPDA